jgi:hypothetical protein
MIKEAIAVVNDIFPIIPLASGKIVLAYGTHEIQIDLPESWWVTYSKVFLYTEEPDGSVPACIGDKNLTGSTLNGNTLIIYADVQSNSCAVVFRVY